MILKKQKIFFLGLILGLGLLTYLPSVAYAAPTTGLVPCGGYSTTSNKPCTLEDAFVLVAKVTNFLIACSGIYAVYVIINASFGLVVYAMGNEEAITKGKEAITNAVLGFVLVLFAYMIINTVTNVLITRNLAVSNNAECKLDLTKPLNYLLINQNPCSNLPESKLHPATN